MGRKESNQTNKLIWNLTDTLTKVWYFGNTASSVDIAIIEQQIFSVLYTLNSKIFARILFSRMALKDTFATFNIHD